MHAPGLKVVAPSTAEDAKGLLIAAIRDPQPGRLPRAQAPLPPREGRGAPRARRTTPFTARVAREGTDLTVIAYGAMVHTALEATEDLDGAIGRGARPALARAARRGGDPRLACARRRRSWSSTRPTRRAPPAPQVAALIADQRLRGPRRPGRAGSRRPTCRSRSRRRSSRRVLPHRRQASRRPAVSSSSTETLVDVTMPQMGVSVSEGTLVEWRKQPGDWVAYEEAVCEISTDKIDTEVPVAGRRARWPRSSSRSARRSRSATVLARIATDAAPGRGARERGRAAGAAAAAGHERGGRRPATPPRRPRRAAPSRPAPRARTATAGGATARRAAHRGRARRRPRPRRGHRPRRAGAQAGRAGVVACEDAAQAARRAEPPLHIESPYRPDRAGAAARRVGRRGAAAAARSRGCAGRSAST